MKKLSTKITAAILSFVFMFAGVFAVYAGAEENNYAYSDYDPIISTVESFKDSFSTTEVDRISYDYEIVPIDTKKMVVVAFEIKVGPNRFMAVAEGFVNSYNLPSGEVLLEGPIDGVILIGNSTYEIKVGFTKVNSSDDVMISVTFTNDSSSLVAFSFGENLIRGEVLDFFIDRTNVNTQTGIDGGLSSEDILTPQIGGSGDVCDPNGPSLNVGEDIFDDGGGEPNLGNYAYKSMAYGRWDNTMYRAYESRYYFYREKGDLLVMMTPCITETQNYADTLGHDLTSVLLYEMTVQLSLDSNVDPQHFAGIFAVKFPEYGTNGLSVQSGSSSFGTDVVVSLIRDYLSLKGIPLDTITILTNQLNAGISIHNDGFISNVSVDLFYSSDLIEQMSSGLAIHFYLIKMNSDYYEGETPYSVTSSATYLFMVQDNIPFLQPSIVNYYEDVTTVYNGVIDL